MELTTQVLTGRTVVELTTEIKFFVAGCKVKKIDIFKLNIKKVYNESREEKRLQSISRILHGIKRSGLIQLYIHSSELCGKSTEAAYINNKYPELYESFSDGDGFIIKL